MDFLGGMLKDICGSDIFSSIYETLSQNLFGAGDYSAALNVVKTLNNAIIPLALMLMFIYFMIAVVDKLSSENFTWEQLWRQMAMLLAAKYLMEHGFELLEIFFNIGMALAAKFDGLGSTLVAEAALDTEALIEGFHDSIGSFLPDFIVKIIMFIYLLIPWLFSWIMRLCVGVICYSRVIEIYARATFAPVAIADFFHSGLHGSGFRFLKSFLAVSLQGAMILVIAMIFSSLFGSITVNEANLFKFIGKYLAFYAAALMMMFKSLSLTKEVIGVN